ncbi:MAG: peptidylprolyl isomerase [Chitinispirillaceae bacterium]|nr:peptidylprolyl isomerase [Chitinispirillaceae bacterium]
MKKLLFLIVVFLLNTNSTAQAPVAAKIQVSITTSEGEIIVELDSARAPITVKNFLDYVKEGFYEGTIFHRVKKGLLIQGGGVTADMARKKAKAPIKNEADNRVSNRRGTIAMARTSNPNSATSQFYINIVSNPNFDFKNQSAMGWGYCVFGRVIKGMEVAESIARIPTGAQDVPTTPVVITKATRLDTPVDLERN